MAEEDQLSHESSHEVQLAIYDLSRGMARQLSSQFLGGGIVLDAIPHTGLIVYGREWYYGGGIQSEHPQQFRANTGLHPMQIIVLGRTRISQNQFEAWCRQHGPTTYNERTYDLLQHNCNHFSRDAIVRGLGLSEAVFPEWILQVPVRFLQSPMGQLVRPMLENMQLAAPVRGGVDSFTPRTPYSSSSLPSNTQTVSTANPWAQSTDRTVPDSTDAAALKVTPILDSFDQPLYSNDTHMVDACIQKLSAIDTDIKELLEQSAPILRSPTSTTTTTATGATLSDDMAKKLVDVLINIAHRRSTSSTLFTCAFLILRLVVWKCPRTSTEPKVCVEKLLPLFRLHGEASTLSSSAKALVLLTVSNAIPKIHHADNSDYNHQSNNDDEFWNVCIETATLMLSQDQTVAVRQVASAVLYNVTWTLTNNEKAYCSNTYDESVKHEMLSDSIVSILCSVIGFIPDETDPTTLLRLFMVLGRMFLPSKNNHSCNPVVLESMSKKATLNAFHCAAITLAKDLGLVDILTNACANIPVNDGSGGNKDAETCRKIVPELTSLLSAI